MGCIIVQNGESEVVSDNDPVTAIATINLGADIAITCYNPADRKVGVARNIDAALLTVFVNDIAGSDPQLVQVRLVGGNATPESKQQLEKLMAVLDAIDGGRDIINIISADIHEKPHPESFKITAFDGLLDAI